MNGCSQLSPKHIWSWSLLLHHEMSEDGCSASFQQPSAPLAGAPRGRTHGLEFSFQRGKSPIGHVAHDSASAGLESSSRGFLHSRQPSLCPCGHRSSLTQLRTCSFTQRSTNRLASQTLGSQCAPPTPAIFDFLCHHLLEGEQCD